MGRVRVYLAASLDGYIAGPDDDLSWLPAVPEGESDPDTVDFAAFTAEIGAMLMGRRTYEVVAGFEGPWPYGDIPILVATRRPLEGARPAVRAVAGSIDALLDAALEAAGGRDVYLDGGDLVRQALAADRVDELILTWVPVLLGGGTPLFGALSARQGLVFEGLGRFGGSMVQVRARRAR